MSLRKYKKKRVFNRTPEPKGNIQPTNGSLHFVIHKHEASHLHYDFRIEINGVLKSWAVPKGPSLDPKIKHLAIMVEDHPYDYKDFEGVIPKGNYGAGSVMIWDEGTYIPAKPSQNYHNDLAEDLKKGHLGIILNGKKLKGKFTLIELKKAERNAWMIFKNTDEFISDQDILKKNKSARSGKSMREIAHPSQKNAIKNIDFKKTPLKSMPRKVQPMLTTLVNQSFNDKNWIFEIKWDGYRILAFLKGNKVKLISRNQIDYSDVFDPIVKELQSWKLHAVLDGEIVVVDEQGRSRFQLLQQYQKTGYGQLVYYVFDLLWLEGHDLKNLSCIDRKNLLSKIFPISETIKISEYIEEKGLEFYQVAINSNLEGIIAKKKNSEYIEAKRTTSWLKIKFRHQQEAVIGGFTEPRGSRKNIGALVLGVYQDNILNYIGHVGGGLNEDTITDLKARLKKLMVKECPFATKPKTNMPATWVKPKLVCEVAFQEWTDEGYLRVPIFLGLREDKSACEVQREVECSLNKAKKKVIIKKESSSSNLKNKDQWRKVNGQRLQLTHLDKIYWPIDGYTKNDLLEYYDSISNFILPYLKDRPESMHRFPHGILGQSFFHKNFEAPPEWIKTFKVKSKHEDKMVRYLLCQNKATLLYMVNLGCIEINPWLSRIQSPDNPDFCVLDLDPEGISFSAVIEAAQNIHELLEEIGAKNYCKTSGATGLHICIPLCAKYSYDQSKQFAELIANIINLRLPKITSVIRSTQKRQKKVYLDFLQNRPNQTIVAPYSVRPRPLAPISTPLQWQEVVIGLNPEQFNLLTIKDRIQKIGDIWKPILGKGINLEKCLAKLKKYSEL